MSLVAPVKDDGFTDVWKAKAPWWVLVCLVIVAVPLPFLAADGWHAGAGATPPQPHQKLAEYALGYMPAMFAAFATLIGGFGIYARGTEQQAQTFMKRCFMVASVEVAAAALCQAAYAWHLLGKNKPVSVIFLALVISHAIFVTVAFAKNVGEGAEAFFKIIFVVLAVCLAVVDVVLFCISQWSF